MMASDIDNDGFVEIVCGTSAGRLYVWKTKGSPDMIEWGSCRANPQNWRIWESHLSEVS